MHAALGTLLLLSTQLASAERVIEIDFKPTGNPQIAVWLEDTDGNFIDTLMVTRLTGTFGLGNRPGRGDFGGSYLWPYGSREMVLPVWAHHRGVEYDKLVFQDCRQDSLGWHEIHSSAEPFYCRPLTPAEQNVDAVSCPTTRFNTDKGIPLRLVQKNNPQCNRIAGIYKEKSFYPPRNDLATKDSSKDWNGVSDFHAINDLDAVSQATPPADQPYKITYRLPESFKDGDYIVWVEVNQAFDANKDHDYDFFVDPMLQDYGVKVLGQPSVIWNIPFKVGVEGWAAQSDKFVGYGSVDGQDGMVRPADSTISDTPETGAGRLLRVNGSEGNYQVRARFNPSSEGCDAAMPVPSLKKVSGDWQGVELLVETPLGNGSDVSRYEVRYAQGKDSIQSKDDFLAAVPGPVLEPPKGSQAMSVRLDLPRDQTTYTVAIRTYNRCGEPSEIAILEVKTEQRIFATVDACFVATAAHGAKYHQDVTTLRRFRDEVLLPTEVGLNVVELYYWAGPSAAEVISGNETLKSGTRLALKPLVWLIQAFE